MSTLKVTNIQSNGAGFNDVVSFQNSGGTQNGTLCRAWVNFNGTGTVAIRASFNVSSITDNGTGDYTVNFTNALADANYCITGTASNTSAGGTAKSLVVSETTAPTSSAVRLVTPLGTAGNFDTIYTSVAIFR